LNLQGLYIRAAATASAIEPGDENSLKPNKAHEHAGRDFESGHSNVNGRNVTKHLVSGSVHEDFLVGDERPVRLKDANIRRPDRVNDDVARKIRILTIAAVGALMAIASGLMADRAIAKWVSEEATAVSFSAIGNVFGGYIRKASFSDDLRKADITSPRVPELNLTPALTLLPQDELSSVEQIEGNKTAPPAGLLSSGSGNRRYADKLRYVRQIQAAAKKTQLDPALIHAVIAVESNHNTLALSNKGALGLMQLMPQTAARYGVENRMDPVQNINGGARYLADLVRLFEGDVQLALAAYNAGEHVVIRYGNRIPPYRETMAYVPRVMSYYEKYKSTFWAVSAIPRGTALRQTFSKPSGVGPAQGIDP